VDPAPVTLDALGVRICIMGPSNSGKSTLAHSIGLARDLPVVHLDRLHHREHTDWHPRPAEEFRALHDAAIGEKRWVMEGNYSRLLEQRLERATGFILLDVSTLAGLVRYVRRCWFDRVRHGALEGGRDSVKWAMIRHIAIATPPNRRRYGALFETVTLPKITLTTPALVERFRKANGLP
jgi:adenylate kinase family enzyme